MKLHWFLLTFAPLLQTHGQITPGQEPANGGNAGIPGVTVTNLTQISMERARNFFIVGGVDLRPNPQNQIAGRNTTVAGTSQTPATMAGEQQLQQLTNARDQLAKQRLVLAVAIAEKRRSGQPWTAEARQHLAMQRAIQQLDAQIAQYSASLKRHVTR